MKFKLVESLIPESNEHRQFYGERNNKNYNPRGLGDKFKSEIDFLNLKYKGKRFVVHHINGKHDDSGNNYSNIGFMPEIAHNKFFDNVINKLKDKESKELSKENREYMKAHSQLSRILQSINNYNESEISKIFSKIDKSEIQKILQEVSEHLAKNGINKDDYFDMCVNIFNQLKENKRNLFFTYSEVQELMKKDITK